MRAKAAKKFKATTNSRHNLPVAPNLLQQDFTATGPSQKYVGVSRPAESHRQPLAEPYVTLSRHTAPIIRPFACSLQCTKAYG